MGKISKWRSRLDNYTATRNMIIEFTQGKKSLKSQLTAYGQSLCDTHYGIPVEATSHITVETSKGLEIIQTLLQEQLGFEPYEFTYTNKLAVLVGEDLDGFKFAYSYDGRKLGFFVMPFNTVKHET